MPSDTNDQRDIFLHVRLFPTTERLSLGLNGSAADGGSMSVDGRIVAFESNASGLVRGDDIGVWGLFALDVELGSLARLGSSMG